MTRLLITRRTIALDRSDEYLALWSRVSAAVQAAGGRSWLFHGSVRQDRALEFVEDDGERGVLRDPAVLAARQSLRESFSSASEEEWTEWIEQELEPEPDGNGT